MFCLLVLLFVRFFVVVSIAVFRVSVALPCNLITPISTETVVKVLELLPLESLSAILEYMFALQQQEESKKLCYLMYSVENIAHVTCMLDDK